MAVRRVESQWTPGPLRCEVRTESGFVVAVDEPVEAGGTDRAPQPTDLFLASIASCFTLALVYTAGRQGVGLGAVAVEVEGTYDGPRFAAIVIRVRLDDVTDDRIARLVAAAQRVCYVTRTLATPPTVDIVT